MGVGTILSRGRCGPTSGYSLSPSGALSADTALSPDSANSDMVRSVLSDTMNLRKEDASSTSDFAIHSLSPSEKHTTCVDSHTHMPKTSVTPILSNTTTKSSTPSDKLGNLANLKTTHAPQNHNLPSNMPDPSNSIDWAEAVTKLSDDQVLHQFTSGRLGEIYLADSVLNDRETLRLKIMLLRFKHAFRIPVFGDTITGYQASIDIIPGAKPAGRVYNHPHHMKNILKTWIDEQLQKGFIVPSDSPWRCGVLFIPKSYPGEFRVYLNTSQLNKFVVNCPWPQTSAQELIER